jgi:hypothetical protein
MGRTALIRITDHDDSHDGRRLLRQWPFLIMRRIALNSADPRQSPSLLILASRA